MRPKAPNPLTDNDLWANCRCLLLMHDRTGWNFLVEFGVSQTEVGSEVVLPVKVNGDHVQRPIGRGQSSDVHGPEPRVGGRKPIVGGPRGGAHGITLRSAAASEVTGVVSQAFRV